MKKANVAAMAAMMMAMAMTAGCGDGSSTSTLSSPATEMTAVEEAKAMNKLFAAARPTGVPGQMEVVAFLPTVPTMQPFVWFTVERTDTPEPVLATLSGKLIAVNPVTGEAKVLIDGLNQGGDYAVKVSTAAPGTNPPQVEPDSDGNPGQLWERTLTFKAAEMTGIWQ